MSDTVNNSEQRKIWKGSFGDEYVDRSTSIESVNKRFLESRGISLEDIIKYFFSDIDRNSAILELGCNVGLNLSILKKLGFKKLSGVEINKKAYEIASENNPEIKFYNSSIEEFNTNEKYELVFTAGVLIHVNPQSIPYIVSKIIKLSNKYIFGLEYYSENTVEISYRGIQNSCWKQNFPQHFLDNGNLEWVKKKIIPYKNETDTDIAYLLKKMNES